MQSDNKLTILYIEPHSAPDGGAEQALILLLKNIDKKRFHPIVLLPDGPMRKLIEQMGVKTYISKTNYLWFENQRHYYLLLNDLNEALSQVVSILDKENVDLIHTNDYWAFSGALGSRLAGVPHLWHLHIPLMNNHPLFRFFPVRTPTFGHLINELSDVVVSVSGGVRVSMAPYVTEEKLEVVYNGIDIEKFNARTTKGLVRRELGIHDKDCVLTSVGRICEQKGFEDLVECAGSVCRERMDVKFLLAGGTDDDEKSRLEYLKSRVSALNLEQKFFFLGRREDVPNILADTDIYVSSSLYEGHPLVILEAMAAAKPVVATRCIGSDEVVMDGDTGYLAKVNRPEELADRILQLIDDKQTCIKMGLNGRERLTNSFGLDSCVNQLELIYLKMSENGTQIPRNTIWPEILTNMLSDLGKLGLQSLEHEWRLKQLENFMDQFKENVFYQSAKKLYKMFS
ncbi:MAG: glycosyltransferase family 4 protein [Deltaproteobacteria bacterium]|nr:glycosyltransferase family 4 protein [Deltaproteobacteria bacterium]